jgi:hypothetical protein
LATPAPGWTCSRAPPRLFQVALSDQRTADLTSRVENHLVNRVLLQAELGGQRIARDLVDHDRHEDPALVRGQFLLHDPAHLGEDARGLRVPRRVDPAGIRAAGLPWLRIAVRRGRPSGCSRRPA